MHRGPRLDLARTVAAAIGADVPDPPPLRRLVEGPQARAGGPRDAAAGDAAALAWDDAAVGPRTAILLLDDVMASGGTLAAAAAAIERDSRGGRRVRSLVLAVARSGDAAGNEPGRGSRDR